MKIEKHDWMIGLGVLLIIVGLALWFMPASSTLTEPGAFAKETAETAVMSVSSGGGFGGAGQCLAEGGGGEGGVVEEYEEF